MAAHGLESSTATGRVIRGAQFQRTLFNGIRFTLSEELFRHHARENLITLLECSLQVALW